MAAGDKKPERGVIVACVTLWVYRDISRRCLDRAARELRARIFGRKPRMMAPTEEPLLSIWRFNGMVTMGAVLADRLEMLAKAGNDEASRILRKLLEMRDKIRNADLKRLGYTVPRSWDTVTGAPISDDESLRIA